jgi:flagellar motor protein MotB
MEGNVSENKITTAIAPYKGQVQHYLDSAVKVLEKTGIVPASEETSRLAQYLSDLAPVDQTRTVVIGRVLEYSSSFNQMMRDEIESVTVKDRYAGIMSRFDSIQADAKGLVAQLDDGKIDLGEKVHNLWMKLSRGTIQSRFGKIKKEYDAVSGDIADQIESESRILTAYSDFRLALQEARAAASDLQKTEEARLNAAQAALQGAQGTVTKYAGSDPTERINLEKARDLAQRGWQDENRRYQLAKDISENLGIGYSVGEVIMAKLGQTNELKRQIHSRSQTFFATNEHTFTALSAALTAELGLHEGTETLNAMTAGMNKSLETVAEIGGKVEKKAREAAYGKTLAVESVRKLVDAVVAYQTETLADVSRLREESKKNADEIAMIVEDGKKRTIEAIRQYALQSKPTA